MLLQEPRRRKRPSVSIISLHKVPVAFAHHFRHLRAVMWRFDKGLCDYTFDLQSYATVYSRCPSYDGKACKCISIMNS